MELRCKIIGEVNQFLDGIAFRLDKPKTFGVSPKCH